MKKISVLLFSLCVGAAYSQNSAVTNASLYRQEGDLIEAKKEIDKAIMHEKTMNEPKTWYYKGLIYSDIFASKEEGIRMLSDSANSVAFNAFQKSMTLENNVKGTYTKLINREPLENLWVNSINEGVKNFEEKNMAKAKRNFEVASKSKPSDTVAANNVLVACQYLKDTTCLIDSYKRMIDKGKEKPEYYVWSFLYYQKRDSTKAIKMLEDGMAKFPSNQLFTQNYIETLFAGKQYAKLKDKLVAYSKANPTDKISKLKLALTYEALNELDNAEAQYKEVLAIDPVNSMSLYNLGVIKYRQALIISNQKDEVKPADRATKGKELDDKYKKTLYESAKYFDEYRKLKVGDEQAKSVLIDIYKRLKRDDMIELLK